MTATEVLRRLLDEHGVEYVLDEEYGEKYPPEKCVTWSCDIAGEDMTVTARDYCININDDGSADYCLDLEFHEVFTPEQAIAATLGRGMLTADDVRDLIERHSDAAGGNGRDFHNGAYVAIADERYECKYRPYSRHFTDPDGFCHKAKPRGG